MIVRLGAVTRPPRSRRRSRIASSRSDSTSLRVSDRSLLRSGRSHIQPATRLRRHGFPKGVRLAAGDLLMHIPDGYLSPETCGTFGAAMVPVWTTAGRRVRKVVKNRYVPLLAIG